MSRRNRPYVILTLPSHNAVRSQECARPGPGLEMSMTATETIHELLAAGAPDAVAIAAVDRPPLTYDALRRLVARTVSSLNALGYGRGDAVSIVLPNGPEMATSFLAVASGCTSAPL